MESYGIHWFRRDLRVAGNPSLQYQWKKNGQRVLTVFCFDKKFLSRNDFSINRFQFFLETLKDLKKQLKSMGSDLLVLDVGPEEAFQLLFESLKKNNLTYPSLMTWGRDYEPFARDRDNRIKKLLSSYQINYTDFRDHLLIEPDELVKQDNEGYKVYTPFSKKWNSLLQQEEFQQRVTKERHSLKFIKDLEIGKLEKIFNLTWDKLFQDKKPLKDYLDYYIQENEKRVTVPIPKAGTLSAYTQLKSFSQKVSGYKIARDFPGEQATSQLSTFLKNGSLTVSQIIHFLKLKPYKEKLSAKDVYLSELIWREFYYHILFRYPEVENQEFIAKFRKLNWVNNEDHFIKWKLGQTGYPIVDAGMRQLKQTGMMHNRVRMIVASFLTKDLLIDWRWGEQYFMQVLLDGDLAANNGGWQWAASTGCDPQPYFRIFNPWLQSKKFDPNGDYIKKYLPELKDMMPNELHKPINDHKIYPKPIVDHSEQRKLALKLYKQDNN